MDSISTRLAAITSSKTFSAFRHRNYRLWFAGQLVSLVGTWMQNTAQGFLIYSLTGSPEYLGLVGFISGIPSWLFMLYGGLVADRMSRRKLMIITQTSMMILAFILAGLVFTGAVQPWHILVLAALAGLAMAFKLIESAQDRWRAVNAPHLVALVRAGARFERGLLVERQDRAA